jgi:predicted nucleotidyltransferase
MPNICWTNYMNAPLSMNLKLNITSKHLGIIRKILNNHLPEHTKVWVFGSRARSGAKKYSDLDLAIECNGGKKISSEIISDLKYEFEESDLPYKVDIVDMSTLSREFQLVVEASKLELNL